MANHLIADITILTVLPEEYKAVHDRLVNPLPAPPSTSTPNLYAWVIGEVPSAQRQTSYSVALGMIGRAGTSSGALATRDAITRWKPRYVFFVGIAGGLQANDLRKGDVVIADLIHGYEYGKLERTFVPRSNWTYRADLALVNGATAFAALCPDWVNDIRADPPEEVTLKVLTGQVASGDKVVDDPTSEFFTRVREQWPKLQAVEMEGAGAANAIEQAQSGGSRVGFLMIRGISDIPRPASEAGIRGTLERDLWKIYAADVAAAFAVSFIANRLPIPPREPPVEQVPVAPPVDKLAEFGLLDERDDAFGESEFTADLDLPGSRYVILAAIPLQRLDVSATDVLKTAKTMLQTENWYPRQPGLDLLPKCWPPYIFKVPSSTRSAGNALAWEDMTRRTDEVRSRLVITGSAEVLFASAHDFVSSVERTTGEVVPIFRIGPILAECWKLCGLVAQLHHEIGYDGRTHLCIGMANTMNSHLGGYANSRYEPYDLKYWLDAALGPYDWSCHSPNLKFCETVDLMKMEPRRQPEFIRRFAEAISLAYNHDTPRCFDRETGLIPERYFRGC